jgi:hypothetical protein
MAGVSRSASIAVFAAMWFYKVCFARNSFCVILNRNYMPHRMNIHTVSTIRCLFTPHTSTSELAGFARFPKTSQRFQFLSIVVQCVSYVMWCVLFMRCRPVILPNPGFRLLLMQVLFERDSAL